MGILDTLGAKAIDAVERITVRPSAMNPILWLCGLITLPAVIVSSFLAIVPSWLIWLACTPVGIASFGYLFLLFVDRDKLQSESFQLRKQTLELIEEKGDIRAIDASTIEVITNPELPALPKDIRADDK